MVPATDRAHDIERLKVKAEKALDENSFLSDATSPAI